MMKTLLKQVCAAVSMLFVVGSLHAANTPGQFTFNLTVSQDGGNYAPRHIQAMWITDASGNFIRTIRYQANNRKQYLYKWIAATGRNNWTTVDGTTGSTTSTYGQMTEYWDCKTTNGVVVADGTYKLWFEFTERNGQGFWTTNGYSFTKGTVAYTNTPTEVYSSYISSPKVMFVPAIVHDVAVTGFTPLTAQTNVNVSIVVGVTNKGDYTESVTVTLTNLTTGSQIGSGLVVSIPSKTSTNLSYAWNTTGVALGNYLLQAQASAVSGETSLMDNTFTNTFIVQATPHDIAVLSVSPSVAFSNALTTVKVMVTNETPTLEAFPIILSNLTAGTMISSQYVSSLAGNTATTINFTWNTVSTAAGDYQLQAKVGPVTNETATTDNFLIKTITVRKGYYDVAVLGIQAPAVVLSNATTNVYVVVTNNGDLAATFNVRLYDDTDGRLISSNQVSALVMGGTNIITASWRTTNSLMAYHSLRAVAGGLVAETNLLDNTNTILAPVAIGVATNIYLAKSNFWRYHDKGLDLGSTPWKEAYYYDETWSSAKAPMGYGMTTLTTTNIYYGTNANNKYPTYYFRVAFNADALATALTLNTRRDDGVVAFLNGVEVARYNMTNGPITYGTWALGAVTDADSYFRTNASASSMVLGRNVMAVEVHQTGATSSDIAFDMEITGLAPVFPVNHDVDVVNVISPADVVVGDNMLFTVILTNSGNATESPLIIIKDMTTGLIVATNTIASLHPADVVQVPFSWKTLGATNGGHTFQAFTVVAGVTNTAGSFTTQPALVGSGMGLQSPGSIGSIGGRCNAVAGSGTTLYVGCGSTLQIYNCADPAALTLLGSLRLPGIIQGLAVTGTRVAAACGSAGLQFIDASQPANPVHVNTFNSSGHAYKVAVSSNYAYLADGVSGLRVIDMTDMNAPAVVGTYYTDGAARDVAITSTKAFLLDSHRGLLAFSIATPSTPSLSGTSHVFDSAVAMTLSGNYAYVVDEANHLFAINVNSFATPQLVGTFVLTNQVAKAIAAVGTTVYVAAGDGGLLTVNLSSPTAGKLVSTITTGGQVNGLLTLSNSLYVANGMGGLHVMSTATATNPVLIAEYDNAIRASDVIVNGNIAYLAGGEAGFRIYSLTNPAAPYWLSWYAGVTNARCVAVSGSMAYVGDGQYGLKVVDVTDPAFPGYVGLWADAQFGSVRSVGVSGSYAVVSDGRKLGLLSIANPAAPQLLGTYDTPAFAYSLAVTNGRAYVACGNAGLQIFSIGSGSISLLGQLAIPGLASGISVSGTKAYVAAGSGGWVLVDVTTPSAPVLQQTFADQGAVTDVAVAGTLATVAGVCNAATLDVTTPLTPVSSASFSRLVNALKVSASGTMSFISEDEAGLSILSAGADLDHDGMPDAWEMQIVNASSTDNIRTIQDVLPNDDFDHDGQSNLAEYLAGTSPVSNTSRFVLDLPAVVGSSSVTLKWTSVASKSYTVWKSTDLNAGFSKLQENIPANPPLNTFQDTSSGTNRAFYIIEVK